MIHSPSDGKPHQPLFLRFLIAVLLPVLGLCFVGSIAILDINKRYNLTRNELRGLEAIAVLSGFMHDMQQLRGLSQIMRWREMPKLENDLAATRDRLNHNLSSPKWLALEREFSLDLQGSNIRRSMEQILSEKDDGAGGERRQFERFTEIITHLQRAIRDTADRSSLILDPEVDTYHLMNLAAEQIPNFREAVARARGLGSGIIARGNAATDNDAMILVGKIAIIRDHHEKFAHDLSVLRDAVPDVAAAIDGRMKQFEKRLDRFLEICAVVQQGDCATLSPQDFFAHGSELLEAIDEIQGVCVAELRERLIRRMGELRQRLVVTLLGAVATILVILYFAASFYAKERRANDDLEKIAITDPLTGIGNRRYLTMVFPREIQRARREGKGFAFGIFDIDFFKKYNDLYGHHAGDLALQQVAKALHPVLQRTGDFYFRFGGEEFCFLFHATSHEQVAAISERIRQAVEDLRIEHRENVVTPVLTISMGVFFIPLVENGDATMDFMIKQADGLLYAAKDAGRNRCVVSAPEVSDKKG